MKITKLELFQVRPRWVFIKISTDEGIVGWGEPTLECHSDSVVASIKEIEVHLIGKNPLETERLFQTLYQCGFYRGGAVKMSAIAGIDQALWDIKGKFFNVPVHQLLGGKVREKIKVYSWIGGDSPNNVIEHAAMRFEQGYRAVKMNATGPCELIGDYAEIDSVVGRVQTLREKMGRDFGIALDFHGRVHKSMAKILVKELEPFRPLFYEEPVLAENNEYLSQLAQHTAIPLATGERMYSKWDFKEVFKQGAIDIIQPDLSHAGGITECKKLAGMAEAFDMAVAPHCPLGPLATAACLQLDASIVNFAIQELSLQIHYNEGAELTDYVHNKEVFEIKDGYVKIPEKPGLGLDIDEEAVLRAHEEGHARQIPPLWTYKDGTIAEW